jgi:hypothetical protein
MRAFLLRIVVTLCLRGARLGPILFHDPLGFHWEAISVQTLPVSVTGTSVKQMPLHAAQESPYYWTQGLVLLDFHGFTGILILLFESDHFRVI